MDKLIKMEDIEIRELQSSQLTEYKAFLEMGLLEDGENLLITPKDNLAAKFPTKDCNDSFTLGAYLNSDLAGVASFCRDGEGREKLQHKGLISTMYVSKKYRNRGIAKLLLIEIINKVKISSSIEQINLIVLSNNLKAKQLYESFGFKKYGTEENSIKWDGQYFAEDLMALNLYTPNL